MPTKKDPALREARRMVPGNDSDPELSIDVYANGLAARLADRIDKLEEVLQEHPDPDQVGPAGEAAWFRHYGEWCETVRAVLRERVDATDS